MLTITTNRDGLLRHLATGKRHDPLFGSIYHTSGLVRPSQGEIALLWESERRSTEGVPEVIVVADGELRSFLAWTSTYLDGFRPLTSLCRVLEAHTLQIAQEAEPPVKFDDIGPACAAITLADALTQGLRKVDETSISITACESTYSFARSRFISAGIRDDTATLRHRWSLARELGRQPQRRLSPEASEPMWILLESLAGTSSGRYYDPPNVELYQLCREYMEAGSITAHRLEMLSRGPARVGHIIDAMAETREQRVTVLDDVLRRTDLRGSTGVEADFTRGYVASLLSPGTVEYLSLVSSYLDEHPTLLMWYTFFGSSAEFVGNLFRKFAAVR